MPVFMLHVRLTSYESKRLASKLVSISPSRLWTQKFRLKASYRGIPTARVCLHDFSLQLSNENHLEVHPRSCHRPAQNLVEEGLIRVDFYRLFKEARKT